MACSYSLTVSSAMLLKNSPLVFHSLKQTYRTLSPNGKGFDRFIMCLLEVVEVAVAGDGPAQINFLGLQQIIV